MDEICNQCDHSCHCCSSECGVCNCEECKCKAFKQTLMLKKLSPLVSPNGQEAIVPVTVFCCEKCGHVNKEFEDAEIKAT